MYNELYKYGKSLLIVVLLCVVITINRLITLNKFIRIIRSKNSWI